MRIDYDQLKALLDEATPGPWEAETRPRLRYANGETWEEIGDILVCSDADPAPLMALPEQTFEEAEQGPDNLANARLMAASPDLARELLRLCDGVEVIRDRCATLAESARSAGIHTLAGEMDVNAKALTGLLNGDTE